MKRRSRESGVGNWEFNHELGADASGFEEGGRGQEIIDHRDLDVWKSSMALAGDIYRLTRKLPSNERFGLISQMRRAAVSIPTNIAEGYGRETSGACLYFLRVSQGSARELETLTELCAQFGYLKESDRAAAASSITRVLMMLRRLIPATEKRNGR
jgi:four helix bundle protein